MKNLKLAKKHFFAIFLIILINGCQKDLSNQKSQIFAEVIPKIKLPSSTMCLTQIQQICALIEHNL